MSSIYDEMNDVELALRTLLKSIDINPHGKHNPYDKLASTLQRPRQLKEYKPNNKIEEIDKALRTMTKPWEKKKKIKKDEVESFIREAIRITKPLQSSTTNLTQIYNQIDKITPNCKDLKEFFESTGSIAKQCHSCYKVQIDVNSLEELLILNFLMKKMRLELNNTRKCTVELRENAKGFYKGLIYCTAIEEAKNVMEEARGFIEEASDVKPIFSIKRGCTEFTNAHKKYGDIGDLENLHPGPEQPYQWEIDEKKFLGEKERTTRLKRSGWEFNLGEMLILKNWIEYAISIGDLKAEDKYGEIGHKNEAISQLARQRKISKNPDT